MDLQNEKTISKEVKEQIDVICKIWQERMGDDLHGVYIHGSLALNSFKEDASDIDMIIILNRKLSRSERLSIAEDIINIDQKPFPIEMSALCIEDIRPWKYPAKCQFHYSDYWTEHYQKLLSGEITESYLVDDDFEDMDIACHVKLSKQCGICVCGQPIETTFPDVPEEDFWQSISNGIDSYEFDVDNPKYYARNMLMLGRILSYKREKKILTKHSAAVWTRRRVPKQYRYIIDNALKVWFFGKKQVEYRPEDLEGLKNYLIDCIKND